MDIEDIISSASHSEADNELASSIRKSRGICMSRSVEHCTPARRRGRGKRRCMDVKNGECSHTNEMCG